MDTQKDLIPPSGIASTCSRPNRCDPITGNAHSKAAMVGAVREQSRFAEKFMSHLLARNARVEEDLVDQLFNPSEKRLARALLLMANFGKRGDASHSRDFLILPVPGGSASPELSSTMLNRKGPEPSVPRRRKDRMPSWQKIQVRRRRAKRCWWHSDDRRRFDLQ
jgi:hypothetical protein